MIKFYAFLAAVPALLAIALQVGLVIGGTGSLVEEIGKFFNWPRLIAFGKQLEAVGLDIPKWVAQLQVYFSKVPKFPLSTLALLVALGGCSAAQTKSETQNAAIVAGCYAAEDLAKGEAGAPGAADDLSDIKTGCQTSLRVWDRAK